MELNRKDWRNDQEKDSSQHNQNFIRKLYLHVDQDPGT